MSHFRRLYRLIFLILATLLTYVTIVAARCIFFGSPGLKAKIRNFAVRSWAIFNCKILNITVNVAGSKPKRPFFLVSNHLSYLDIVVFFSQIDCNFVAKAELRKWPVLGPIIASAGTIFINRTRRQELPAVNKAVEKAIKQEQGIIVFPEGTASKGECVLPFRPPLLEVIARNNYPAYYASIFYKTEPPDPPAHNVVCWWDDVSFSSHFLNLLKLSGIETRIAFGHDAVSGNDRKIISKELWKRVNKNFTPSFKK